MEEVQKQAAAPRPAGREDNAAASYKPRLWQRWPVILIGTVALAALLFIGLRYLVRSWTYESTDDAFLDGHIISLAPKVAGRVKQVYVTDNQLVQPGDLVVEIDPRDFQVQLDQKRAAVNAARANVELLKANLELSRAQVASAEATAKQSTAEAAAAQATAERAKADLKRAQELIQNHTISPQEFDTAKAAATATEATFQAAREKAASDQSKVVEAQTQLAASAKALDRGEAQTRQADWDAQAAELNLSYTRVTAPETGRVTKKAVENGNYVQAGQALMALVSPSVWITANFKETQLKMIRTNQLTKITIDSVGGRTFTGRVDSIQAGSGARFSLLPPENAVGNYVKVVQRVPVKIVFDNPIEAGHVLGPGMSVVPSIRVRNVEIPEALIAAAAVVAALVFGAIWWRLARRKRAGEVVP